MRKTNSFKTKKHTITKWNPWIAVKLRRRKAKANIKYKDSLFTKLFCNKEKAVELYNALYQKNLPKNTPIEMVPLDDALFVKRKNDVAFLIDGHLLIFIEHQSTLNENMPLRLLIYVAQEYEKIFGYMMVNGKQVSNPNLYKEKLIQIPKPEFFVLYNGTEDLTEINDKGEKVQVCEKVMRLSDAFFNNDSESENTLELCVKLIDIRYRSGHQSLRNKESLSILGEYSYFVKEREECLKKGKDAKTAAMEATRNCIEKGILREFLLKHETEVVGMLMGIYDEELEKQVIREEAEARGEARGEMRGIISTLLELGYQNTEIITMLQKKLKVSKQKAEAYLEEYDNSIL